MLLARRYRYGMERAQLQRVAQVSALLQALIQFVLDSCDWNWLIRRGLLLGRLIGLLVAIWRILGCTFVFIVHLYQELVERRQVIVEVLIADIVYVRYEVVAGSQLRGNLLG